MTDHNIDLALTFLQYQPAVAAGILEQLPLEQVAAFLGSVPHPHAAGVLEKMLPQYTARLLKNLQPVTSAAILSDLKISQVTAIIRHSGEKLGKELLDLLPDKTSVACRLLLNYSEEAVGAWMITNVSSIPADCNIEEAFNRIRSEQKTIDTGTTFVVDRDRLIKGVLNLSTLIRSAPNTSVMVAMEKTRESISARTALITAITHPAWANSDNMPVTNRHQQLVGVLRYVDLRKGLEQTSTTITKPIGAGPITGIYESYGKCLLELFNAVADIAQTKPNRVN